MSTRRPRSRMKAVQRNAENLPVLMLAALPLLLWLFDGSPARMVGALFHFALMGAAAWLIAEGHEAHRRYDAATAAPRPRVPRKLLGACLLGLMVFLLAAARFTEVVTPLCFGLAAAGFAIAAFGLDPMQDKGLTDPDYLAAREADALMTRTDAALRDVVDRVAALRNDPLTMRSEAMHGAVLRLLRAMGTEPRALLALRAPIEKFVLMAEAEAARLEADWPRNPAGAGHTYATRLSALTAAFEAGARQRRQRDCPDAYAMEADLIVERMRSERAAA
ncbi:hypothetical protein LVO79_00835 [Roseivivax marinus]|nr:hypothetical protein [Roseivivax marinus]UMA65055.1 hypothetical protein LVO79_00835 [Roseivivax marinus]